MDERELPMFPLGTVLFPFAPLPLHVFEPRYRALVRHCLDTEPEFGVVLIERGSEVGGGDTRFGIGTVARIVQLAELPDGRSLLVAVGTRRIRVEDWLPDDPYPRALVAPFEDDERTGDVPGTLVDDVRRVLLRVTSLRSELGVPSPSADPPVPDHHDDVARASFELAARAHVNPLDAQRVLEQTNAHARLAMLHELLTDEATVLEHQLGAG